MDRNIKQIEEKISKMTEEEIESEKNFILDHNKTLKILIDENNNNYQSFLISSPWGSGKTHTLKILAANNLEQIKNCLKTSFSIDEEKINSFSSFEDIVNDLEIQHENINIKNLINSYNKFLFINIDEVLYSKNWINSLYSIIFQNLTKFISEEKIKAYSKEYGVKNLDKIKETTLNFGAKMTIPISFVNVEIESNIEHKKNNDIEKDCNIIDVVNLIDDPLFKNFIFIFENLERVHDDKIINFFAIFQQLLNNDYQHTHKFVVTIDDNILLTKLNLNDNRDNFFNKYFDIQMNLNTSKIKKWDFIDKKIYDYMNLSVPSNSSIPSAIHNLYNSNYKSNLNPFQISIINYIDSKSIRELILDCKNTKILDNKKFNSIYEWLSNNNTSANINLQIIQKYWNTVNICLEEKIFLACFYINLLNKDDLIWEIHIENSNQITKSQWSLRLHQNDKVNEKNRIINELTFEIIDEHFTQNDFHI